MTAAFTCAYDSRKPAPCQDNKDIFFFIPDHIFPENISGYTILQDLPVSVLSPSYEKRMPAPGIPSYHNKRKAAYTAQIHGTQP